MKKSDKLRRIGGWLLVYIIFLILVIMGKIFVSIYFKKFSAGFTTIYGSIFTILDIFFVILIIFSLISMSLKKQKTIPLNKITLWFGLITHLLNAFLYTIFQKSLTLFINQLYFYLIMVAWIFYWNKSKRVKSTFIKQ